MEKLPLSSPSHNPQISDYNFSTILDRRDQRDTVATISYCSHPCLRQGPTRTSFHRLDRVGTEVTVHEVSRSVTVQDSVVLRSLAAINRRAFISSKSRPQSQN
jgi:hypothetical protein